MISSTKTVREAPLKDPCILYVAPYIYMNHDFAMVCEPGNHAGKAAGHLYLRVVIVSYRLRLTTSLHQCGYLPSMRIPLVLEVDLW